MTKTSTWESAVTVGIIALSALANLALVSATRLHIRPNNEEPMNLINVGNVGNVGKKETAPEGEARREARSTPQTGGCRLSWDCGKGEDCTGSVWDRILKKGACTKTVIDAEPEPVVTEPSAREAAEDEASLAEAAEAWQQGQDAVIAAWEQECPKLSNDECEKTKQCEKRDGKCTVNKPQIIYTMNLNPVPTTEERARARARKERAREERARKERARKERAREERARKERAREERKAEAKENLESAAGALGLTLEPGHPKIPRTVHAYPARPADGDDYSGSGDPIRKRRNGQNNDSV